eukprot:3927823-Prymnesium_polylepis.1
MCFGSHHATKRREKHAQRARGEDRGPHQTSNRHPVGPGVVGSITSMGPVARAPSRAPATSQGERARGYAENPELLQGVRDL